jgi:hypothetical protein
MEVYHPPYEFRPNRPRFTNRPPNFVTYGSVFEVEYAFDEAADVAGVVLVNAGGVSHDVDVMGCIHAAAVLAACAPRS